MIVDSKTVRVADLSSENRRSRISKLPIRESWYGCVDLLKGTHVLADGYPRFVIDANRITCGDISSGLDEAMAMVALLLGQENCAARSLFSF